MTGKNVKLNLQNELLLVNDVPVNKNVKINIKISSSGDITSVKMIQSSGSGSIDASIEKVVSDTLKYIKPPSSGLLTKSANVSLVISLN